MSSPDNFCKQFGQYISLASIESDTQMVFMKEFFEKVDFEKISRRQKSMFNFPGSKELSQLMTVLIDFSLTVKAATLIFISGHGLAISSAQWGISVSIYNW